MSFTAGPEGQPGVGSPVDGMQYADAIAEITRVSGAETSGLNSMDRLNAFLGRTAPALRVIIEAQCDTLPPSPDKRINTLGDGVLSLSLPERSLVVVDDKDAIYGQSEAGYFDDAVVTYAVRLPLGPLQQTEEAEGRLVYATRRDSMHRPRRFYPTKVRPDLSSDNPRIEQALAEDRKNLDWYARYGGGVIEYADKASYLGYARVVQSLASDILRVVPIPSGESH